MLKKNIFFVAANEACPKAQTAEHLAAVEIMKLNSLMILQSKIDLVGRVRAEDSRQQIERFVQGTCAENAAIIPISAQFNGNMDAVCDYLVRHIPVPIRDFSAIPRMTSKRKPICSKKINMSVLFSYSHSFIRCE